MIMDLLDGIISRTSALKLAEPGPTPQALQRILEAGIRAPDHGRLRPWRFTVLEGEARGRLGDIMGQLLAEKVPHAREEHLQAERNKVLRAPTIVIVGARIAPGKIPEIEQFAAACAAVQNMLLAAHALGYGAMWKTGGAAYDDRVKALAGLTPQDHIVGFVYIGSSAMPGPLVEASLDDVVTRL